MWFFNTDSTVTHLTSDDVARVRCCREAERLTLIYRHVSAGGGSNRWLGWRRLLRFYTNEIEAELEKHRAYFLS